MHKDIGDHRQIVEGRCGQKAVGGCYADTKQVIRINKYTEKSDANTKSGEDFRL